MAKRRRERKRSTNGSGDEQPTSTSRAKRYLTLSDRQSLVTSAAKQGHEEGFKIGYQRAHEELQGEILRLTRQNETLEIVVAGLHPAATALATLARGPEND